MFVSPICIASGTNPVLVAGNKVDLLPKDLKKERVTKVQLSKEDNYPLFIIIMNSRSSSMYFLNDIVACVAVYYSAGRIGYTILYGVHVTTYRYDLYIILYSYEV